GTGPVRSFVPDGTRFIFVPQPSDKSLGYFRASLRDVESRHAKHARKPAAALRVSAFDNFSLPARYERAESLNITDRRPPLPCPPLACSMFTTAYSRGGPGAQDLSRWNTRTANRRLERTEALTRNYPAFAADF